MTFNFHAANELSEPDEYPTLEAVGLLEADPFLLRGWSSVLREAGVAIAGEWSTAAEAEAVLLRGAAIPKTVMVGLGAEPTAELQLISQSVRQGRGVHFVCVGDARGGEALAWAVLRAGARAFAHRQELTPEGITTLLQAVASGFRVLPGPAGFDPTPPGDLEATATPAGYSTLSPREREVLGHLCQGFDNLKLAAVLGIAERTVKAHVSTLYRKLGCENRGQLIILARDAGLHLRREGGSSAEVAPPPATESLLRASS